MMDTCNTSVALVRTHVRSAKAQQQAITVAWITGHVGITGDERADEAAMAQLHALILPSTDLISPPIQSDQGFDLAVVKREERIARRG